MLGVFAVLALATLAPSAPTPLRLTADVADAYALDANPAGLAFLPGAELRLLYRRSDLDPPPGSSGPVNGFGAYAAARAFGPLSFGAAVDVDVDDLDRTGFRFVFGSALKLGRLGVGWTVDRTRRPGGEAKTRVSAGLSHRWTSWFATGLAVHDLAQTLDRRRWDLGLAVRPHDRVVLSARWRLTQDQTVFDADTLDLTGLLSVEPFDGVRLGVGAQRAPGVDIALTGQLELGFGNLAVGVSGLAINDGPSLVADVAAFSRRGTSLYTPSVVAIVDIVGELRPEGRLDLLRQRVRVSPYGDLPLLLEQLATTDRVAGVLARIGPISAGWAKAEEVRAGLRRLRATGRRVDCLLTGSGDVAYFIATGCDAVIVPPPSMLRVDGVSATSLFFGELLERVGVDPEVSRRGKYKSSPEQLTRAGMSPAQREALGAYLDDVYSTLVDGIAEGREIEPERVRALLDLGTHTASQALSRGLVDHLLYPDEVEKHLQETYERRLSFKGAAAALRARPVRWGPHPRIAVVYVDANITGGESTDLPFGLGQTVGARTLVLALEALRVERDVRAVVLRVDSPGGDSLASDLIARAVERVQKSKPVIVSFGDVAASGGYYVAAPATAIYAAPTTLTGSIGVFSLRVSASRLLARLGVGVDRVQRGALSGGGSPYLAWTDVERARVDEIVDHYYEQFLAVVAEGRKMDRDAVHAVAQGRIWSGRAAKREGLVDELGGFVAAIQRARQEAGFDPDDSVDLWVYPRNRSPLPRPVRTFAEALGLIPPPSAGVDRLVRALVPPGLASVLAPHLATGRDPEAFALLPLALDID